MYAMTAAHPTMPIPSYARIRNPANGREVIVRVNDRGPFDPGRIVDLSYAAALKLDLLRGVAPVELERITHEEIRTGAWRGAPRRRDDGGRGQRGAGHRRCRGSGCGRGFDAEPRSRRRHGRWRRHERSAGGGGRRPAPHPCRRTRTRAAHPSLVRATAGARDEAARGFWVQLGAFRERDGAETFRRRVGGDGDAGWLEPLLAIVGDASLWRVQAGPYPGRDEAEAAARRARASLGLVPVVVERR